MPQAVRLWEVSENKTLTEYTPASLDLESRLEDWLAADIAILSSELLVIGRQLTTEFGGILDLLCIDRAGDLVVVELKRDKTPREITAQVLDYASWVTDLSNDAIVRIAEDYLPDRMSLDEAYRCRFKEDLPDSLNDSHHMLVVASSVDASSERIIKYLSSEYGVSINAVTFNYFKNAGTEFIARVFLIDPDEVDQKVRVRGGSKRRPNLSYRDLEEMAAENGVAELYGLLVAGLSEVLKKGTTLSSIGFNGLLDDRRKAIVSLLPGESSPERGVHLQVYFERFRRFFGLSEEQALAVLPATRKPWKYYESADADYSGYEGDIATREEAEHFLKSISR